MNPTDTIVKAAIEEAAAIVEQAPVESLIRANEAAALRAEWQAVRRGW